MLFTIAALSVLQVPIYIYNFCFRTAR